MSFQSVTILGNVGKQPEIRTTNGGTKVASFSIAVSRKRGDDEKTVWFNCIAFAKTSEIVERYVQKGSKVLVQGEISTREYDDKDGNRRYVWEVLVDRLSLESPKESGGADTSSRGTPSRDLDDGEDLPF